MPSPLTDDKLQALVAAIESGDSAAANELFDHVRSFVREATDDRIESGLSAKLSSSDIVQKSLMEAFEQLSSFRGSTVAQFRSWLQTLARNNLIDAERQFHASQRRDISREVPLAAMSPLAGPDRTASSYHREIEADRELWGAVRQLPDHEQHIIELRHRYKLSHAAIAQRLELTEESVRKKLSRSIQKLRERLTR